MRDDREFEQIEALVEAFRARMGVPDDIVLDLTDLLRRMKLSGELTEFGERDLADMGDSAAMFEPARNAIFLRLGMLDQQSARDRFTIAHEIGHKIDGHKHLRHRKATSAKQFGRQVQKDEAIANAVAAALLIPERLAQVDQSTTVAQLAQRFGVSMPVAERRLLDLQRRDRQRRGLRRPIPKSFDSGNYDDSMAQMARNSRNWYR